jgi:hypothetical protein
MNNEPVAIVELGGEVTWLTDVLPYKAKLYTHPVKEQGNPVAWRSQDPDGYWSVYQAPVEGAEPLYTGFREITDEEILKVSANKFFMSEHRLVLLFARELLRKAQE